MEGGLALTQKGILDYQFVYILSQFQVKELGFHSAVQSAIGEGILCRHTSLRGIQLSLCGFRAGPQPGASPLQRVGGETLRNPSTQKPAEENAEMAKGLRAWVELSMLIPHMSLLQLWIFLEAL